MRQQIVDAGIYASCSLLCHARFVCEIDNGLDIGTDEQQLLAPIIEGETGRA